MQRKTHDGETPLFNCDDIRRFQTVEAMTADANEPPTDVVYFGGDGWANAQDVSAQDPDAGK